jgi:hypothetical protein
MKPKYNTIGTTRDRIHDRLHSPQTFAEKKTTKPHPCFQETMQEGPVLNHSLNPDRRTDTCTKDPKCISETEAFAYLPAIPTLIKTPFPCPPVTPRACTNSYAAADRCTLGQALAATTELAVAICAQTRTERERERLSPSLSQSNLGTHSLQLCCIFPRALH